MTQPNLNQSPPPAPPPTSQTDPVPSPLTTPDRPVAERSPPSSGSVTQTSSPTATDPAKSDAAAAPKADGEPAEGAAPERAAIDPAKEYAGLKWPEGLEPGDEAATNDALGFFAENGFTKGLAQAAINRYAQLHQLQMDTYRAQTEKWAEDTRQDPDLGRGNLARTLELSAKGRDAFATPELVDLLSGYGLSNHPAVVRLFRDVGRQVAEDRLVTPGSRPPAASLATRLYPATPGMEP